MEALEELRECRPEILGRGGVGVGTAPGCGGGGLSDWGSAVVRVGDGTGEYCSAREDLGTLEGVAKLGAAPGRAGE